MVNINRQERLCPHILRTDSLHLPLFSSLSSFSINAIKSQTNVKNAGFLECCHGSCFQSHPMERGCSSLLSL